MKASNTNSQQPDAFSELLKRLSPESKVEMIERLSQSLKEDLATGESDAFGSWIGDGTAEELIESIQSSRLFNRRIEEL